MPQLLFNNHILQVEQGMTIKDALALHGLTPHNGASDTFNCRGLGTCGTCAVGVKGKVSRQTAIEKWRLSFPPHKPENSLRLACQCKIMGDVVVTKYAGFWGQLVNIAPDTDTDLDAKTG